MLRDEIEKKDKDIEKKGNHYTLIILMLIYAIDARYSVLLKDMQSLKEENEEYKVRRFEFTPPSIPSNSYIMLLIL